jgi:hypothetical protein
MPRYTIDDPEMGELIAYLKTLDTKPSPGVSGSVVHLATVIGPDVPSQRKTQMLDVMQRYVDDHNARAGAGDGPAPLRWQLDVWTLSGTAVERRAQMILYYQKQPVLALVGGLTADTWLPQHQFCQEFKVACLFPNTSLPVTSMPAFYALYYDKGSVLDAQILARYFTDHAGEFGKGRIVQVVPRNWFGYEPAAALRGVFGRARARRIFDQVVEENAKLPVEFWRTLLDPGDVAAIVIWMDNPDLAGLADASAGHRLPPVFLAGSRDVGRLSGADPRIRDSLRMVLPRNPQATPPGEASWRDWMQAHALAIGEPELQANSYFVMRLLDEALRTSDGVYTSERVIERIEYSAGAVVAHPLLPSLNLGMGQRFAVKGAYILSAGAGSAAGTLVASDLIVP